MIVDELQMDVADFEGRTGWAIKSEGACRGDVCVPLPGAVEGDRIDVRVAAERLAMPVVADDAHGRWAVGPATVTGRALTTAAVPDLELPDVNGAPFALSSLRGRKVLLVAWASW